MAPQLQTALSILRRKQLEQQTGLHCSTIYEKLNPKHPRYDPTFPTPIKLSARAVGWIESEIRDWLNAQIEKRHKAS